jgi:hypothetical protein
MPTFSMVDDNDVEHELPGTWEICGRCCGEGKHVNPGVDGDGISQEEFDHDPDFEEAYFSGVYDVTCEECDGAGKHVVPDFKSWPVDLAKLYKEQIKQQAEWDRQERMERLMGA